MEKITITWQREATAHGTPELQRATFEFGFGSMVVASRFYEEVQQRALNAYQLYSKIKLVDDKGVSDSANPSLPQCGESIRRVELPRIPTSEK